MKISINLWVLRNKQYDGIGYFSIHAISRLIKSTPDIHYDLLLPTNYKEEFFNFPNVKIHKIFPPFRHPILYIFFLEIVASIYYKFIQPDIVLSMDGMISLSSNTRQIAFIYDINFFHFPEVLNLKNRFFYNYFYPKYAKKAEHIFTISEFSKSDMIENYAIPKTKITNVSCAANIGIQEVNIDAIKQTKKKYSMGKEYFFFIGSQMPRKNLTRLILAFDQFKTKTNSDFKLIISGRLSWDSDSLKNLTSDLDHKSDIIFTGRVSDLELTNLLCGSHGLCFVSLFEGFGIPILEAMNCNVPIITSNTTSMPEIAEDAAILVDPFCVDSITEGITLLYLNQNHLRETMIAKGQVNRLKYTWEKTAKQILNILSNY